MTMTLYWCLCATLYFTKTKKKKSGVCTFWLVKWGMQENQCSKYNAFENIYKCKQEMTDDLRKCVTHCKLPDGKQMQLKLQIWIKYNIRDSFLRDLQCSTLCFVHIPVEKLTRFTLLWMSFVHFKELLDCATCSLYWKTHQNLYLIQFYNLKVITGWKPGSCFNVERCSSKLIIYLQSLSLSLHWQLITKAAY